MKLVGVLVVSLVGLLGMACGSSATSNGAVPASEVCEGGTCPEVRPCTGNEGLVQIEGDCRRNTCVDGAVVSVPDDADAPATTDACTLDTCDAGSVRKKPKAAGTTCADGSCDAAGACVKSLGAACNANSDCPSGFCVDGVCCNTACRGECQACDVQGSRGVCSNVPYYLPDKLFERNGSEGSCDLPTAGARCNGAGKCLKISGTQCNANDQCMSNQCALNTTQKCVGAKGEACFANADCVSGTCLAGTCQ
jgi:hypothetical protein